ncbi:retbindin [Protopterus annectens]|uniref:retbindin n=1 Tax=Protopterus annectens TaxID=7888 RepID=UPI001CFA5DAF|nr:retbindin [Protopterus annectens]
METRAAAFIMWHTLAFLCVIASCQATNCLAGGKHKDSPGPEPQLQECLLYSENACCVKDINEELAISPLSQVNDIYWNRCGNLSTKCENFMKRVECFYRCSPDAARWPHPERSTAIQGVPLCHQFCDQWYEACEEDLTCARNWITDWQWGPQGNNCTGDCITYKQMYRDGKDLCENIWADAFTVVDGQCPCFTLTESDAGLSWTALNDEGDSSEDPDTTKDNIVAASGPCQTTPSPLVTRIKNSIRKRSVFMEDVEGSGSGF